MFKESRGPVQKNLTPKEAEVFLAINNFPGQRQYDPVFGQYHADNMRSGTERRIEIAIAYVKETDVEFLVNGQHACRAVILYGKEYKATITYYVCDTMEDAWRLFATFDVHRARTAAQFIKSRRGLFLDKRLHEIALRPMTVAGSALLSIGGGINPTFVTGNAKSKAKTEKADLIEKYSGCVLFVSKFSEYDHLMRVGVATAMIASYRVSPSHAFDFWTSVGNGEMLKRGDPRYKLREALLNDAPLAGNGRKQQEFQYAVCASWWNSWALNQPRTSVKFAAMKDLPIIEKPRNNSDAA